MKRHKTHNSMIFLRLLCLFVAIRRSALTPSSSPTGAGEGSAALSVEASHSDQRE